MCSSYRQQVRHGAAGRKRIIKPIEMFPHSMQVRGRKLLGKSSGSWLLLLDSVEMVFV